ncbi:MAG: AAA family ATPase [Bacteroidota bacterium]
MSLSSINIGQREVKSLLNSYIIKDRTPSAFLFYGPPGSGKSFFAHHFIQDILCLHSQDGFACEICESCKTTKALSSPDLYRVSSTEGISIKIDDIRKAQEFAHLQPVYSYRKFIWIDDAHLLTVEAFNSILKILEEPNRSTQFLLTTSKIDSILTTIKSRASLIPFAKYSLNDCKAILLKMECTEEKAELLAHIGNGNIKKSISYLEPALLENRNSYLNGFFGLLHKASWIPSFQSKEDVLQFISSSLSVLKDLYQMKLLQDKASIINMDYKDTLDQFMPKIDMIKIVKIIELFLIGETDLNRINLNLKGYFDFLCFSVKQIALFN